MKRKRLTIVALLVAAICFLGVGYAAISNTLLTINGTASATTDDNNFVVKMTGTPSTSGDGSVTATINPDGLSATLTASGFTTTGDATTTTFTISNLSEELAANLAVTVYQGTTGETVWSSTSSEYFNISAGIAENTAALVHGNTRNVTVTIILKATPVSDVASETFRIVVTATPAA